MSVKTTITEDLLPKLVKILKCLLEEVPNEFKIPESEICSNFPKDERKYATKTIGQDCVKLLLECLSGHRYKEAVDILWIVCQDRSISDVFVFKASLVVLNNLQVAEEEEALFEKIITIFGCCMKFKNLLNKKEVILEYIVQALVHRCNDLMIHLQKLFPPRRRWMKKLEKGCSLVIDLCEGYFTYLKCLELCEKKISSKENSSALDKAVKNIHSLIANPGNWDIFVLKLVEALENFHRKEDARKVLCDYAEQQAQNLNAQIYFCLYLQKNEPESKQLVKHLKEIARLSPSDERVLLLLKKWKKKGLTFSESLNLIFMFLDYPTNGKNISAWRILRKLLKYAYKSSEKSYLKSVKTDWKSRKKSWLWLHFNPAIHLSNTDETLLVSTKVKVLLLLDKDHEFIKTTYEKFPHLEVE